MVSHDRAGLALRRNSGVGRAPTPGGRPSCITNTMRNSSAPCTLKNRGRVYPSEDRPTLIRLRSACGIRCRQRKDVRCNSTGSTTTTRPMSRAPKYLPRTAQEVQMSPFTIRSTRRLPIQPPPRLSSQLCIRFATLPARLFSVLNQISVLSIHVCLSISHLESQQSLHLELPRFSHMSRNQRLL